MGGGGAITAPHHLATRFTEMAINSWPPLSRPSVYFLWSSSGVKSNLGICCMPVPYIPHPLFSGRTLSLPCIKSSWLPAALRFAVAFHQSTAVLWLVPPEAKWCKTNLDWLKNAINDLTCHMIHRITSSVPTTWFYIQGIGQGYMEWLGLK